MKILIACEESGVVRRAFRAKGHDAWSCDILPSRDNSEFHIQGDVTPVIHQGWDMMIGHPECRFIANCQAWRESKPGQEWRKPHRIKGIGFFRMLWEAPIQKICLENPKSIASTHVAPKTQTIHPYQFGHLEMKETWLWLKGLPKLISTDDVREETMKLPVKLRQKIWYASPGLNRSRDRSVTYQGIANAMAEQWG